MFRSGLRCSNQLLPNPRDLQCVESSRQEAEESGSSKGSIVPDKVCPGISGFGGDHAGSYEEEEGPEKGEDCLHRVPWMVPQIRTAGRGKY